MDDPLNNKDGMLFRLVISVALSAIAIGLAPLTFLAAKYEIFGVLSFHFMFMIIPFISFLIAIVSLVLAIIGRRAFRFGWVFTILSCCAMAFPFFYIYWSFTLHGGR